MIKYDFEDLIDLKELESIFKNFSIISGFALGIVDIKTSEIVVTTGWRKICLNFHRKNSLSLEQCNISNSQLLTLSMESNKIKIHRCNNGLIYASVPIIINGIHYANIFTGQVFFKEPDMAFFENQLKEYGYDQAKYMDSLLEVPIIKAGEFNDILEFISSMVGMLIKQGLKNLENEEIIKNLG